MTSFDEAKARKTLQQHWRARWDDWEKIMHRDRNAAKGNERGDFKEADVRVTQTVESKEHRRKAISHDI